MDTSPGATLARLLLAGFTTLVEEVVMELERRGHPGVTSTHEFALQAIDGGAQGASELGRSLGVSKQAAAKTIAALEDLGYLDRHDDPKDKRRKHLAVTARGREMMAIGANPPDATLYNKSNPKLSKITSRFPYPEPLVGREIIFYLESRMKKDQPGN